MHIQLSLVSRRAVLLASLALVAACSRGPAIDGDYVIAKGAPASAWPVTVTLGQGKFVLSSGASGDYKVSEGKVLMTSFSFSQVLKIDGDKLVNEKWEFARKRTPEWAKDCSNISDNREKTICLNLKTTAEQEEAKWQNLNPKRW
jgi:hypothetical protein